MSSQGSVIASDKTTVEKRCKESIGDFSARLYEQLYQQPGNIFYSPLSIATCLQLVYHGAKGNTKKQMSEVLSLLGVEDEDVLSFYEQLMLALNSTDNNDVLLSLANKVWIKDNFKVLDTYSDVLKDRLRSNVASNPFTDPMAVTKEVNSWVDGQTKGMIKEILTPDMIDSATRMVLCNAVYFKGLWVHPFDFSEDEDFHLNAKDKVKVKMMMHRSSKRMMYGENDVARFVCMDYKGRSQMTMMIILPQVPYQLKKVEEKIMKPGVLNDWFMSMGSKEVMLKMPKFKFEEKYDLAALLKGMGVTDMFDGTKADFSGINGNPDDLYVAAAVHKSIIEVDEEGTEAAAATAMMLLTRCAILKPQKPTIFTVDQPFLFVMRYKSTTVFAGRYEAPV